MHLYGQLIIISFLFCNEVCQAQMRSKSSYRPKLAELSISSVNSHYMTSSSDDFGNESIDKRFVRVRFKTLAPIIVKDSLKVGLQLSYLQQRFLFGGDKRSPSTDFGRHLTDENFKNVGATLLVQKSLSNNSKLTLVGGFGYNGTHLDFNPNGRKYVFSTFYQKRLNPSLSIGGGFLLNYNDVGIRALPLFTFDKDLSNKWNLTLTLPRSIKARYQVSNKSFLTFNVEVDGWRYNLGSAYQDYGANQLIISRLDLNKSLIFEKEINDWLWFGAEAGWNQNLRYFIAEAGEQYRDALDTFSEASAPFGKLSLFVVVPSKFVR